MTIHYHGTPITPRADMLQFMGGRHFCVSFADPRDVAVCHQIGQSVMLDNGAYSFWRGGEPAGMGYIRMPEGVGRRIDLTNLYALYCAWVEEWASYRTTWAVIPDVIGVDDAGLCQELNCHLIDQWPKSIPRWQSAPVWHLHESIDHLRWLVERWPRVCIGSSGRFSQVGSDAWHRRMDVAFNVISDPSGRVPCQLHMLRGMKMCESYYPFASVDSTDVARNWNLDGNMQARADRWDHMQCPGRWYRKMEQLALEQ